MFPEENISLDCPACGEAIYRPLSWFRKTYSTCPACGAGLAAAQFASALEAIEQEFEASDDELVHGKPSGGGCCGRH